MNVTDSHREPVADVSNVTADTDRLVTVAVAPEDSVAAMHERIEEADARAEYLADGTNTPERRREALRRARRILARYDETPENGLVVYTGVVDGDLTDYVFDDPRTPIPETFLDHGNTFDTTPLDAAPTTTTASTTTTATTTTTASTTTTATSTAADGDTYGLLVVERGGAALGTTDGHTVDVHETLDSDVPGKTRAGGQSADRFERRREARKTDFFKEVAATAKREFLDESGHDTAVDALFLGGTEITVENFRNENHLDHRLADRVRDTYHVEYANEHGLHELATHARETITENDAAPEPLDAFYDRLQTDDPVTYGRDATDTALDYDAVDTLLVADTLPLEDRRTLRDRVENQGGDYVTIPTDTNDGHRFATAFDGVAALLRFPIE